MRIMGFISAGAFGGAIGTAASIFANLQNWGMLALTIGIWFMWLNLLAHINNR